MEEEYPTSSTIPFPYPSGPYPQQAALMDAMLQSLRIVDEEQIRRWEQVENEQLLQSSLSKSKANVMMLESPTGTGKSLSLACASLAWLRYREKRDLKLLHEREENDGSNGSNDNSSRCVSSSKYSTNHKEGQKDHDVNSTATKSWLRDWIPPEEIAKRKQTKECKKQCHQRATLSRKNLDQELNQIRRRISNRESSRMKKNDFYKNRIGGGSCSNSNNKMNHAVMKGIREEIVKESIEQVVRLERHQYSKERKMKKSKTNAPQEQFDNILVEKNQGKEADFCVDEYHSDNDTNVTDSRRKHSSFSQYVALSSEDEDEDERIQNGIIQTKKNDKVESKSKTYNQSAQSILDGGQLDGSGFNRRKFYSNDNKMIDEHSSNTSAPTTPTVGGCKASTGVRKIIYAARTHSQLSQFVSEIRRTAWGNDIRVIALGGRKLLCGNKDVTGSGRMKRSETMITEKCLDLQKGYVTVNDGSAGKNDSVKKKRKQQSRNKKTSCPLLSSKEAISTLALHMLAKPSDIEDLVLLGEKSHTCSYYASRESLKAAEVVVVPYNTLLSKPARQAIGLSLQSSLVIIDEAHNIPETLRGLSSCQLTLPMIEGASSQLNAYVKRYSTRLAGKNVFFLGQIRKILTALSKHLKSKKVPWSKRGEALPKSFMVTSTELFFTLKLDNINLFNIMKYLERSRLSQKLHGFTSLIHQGEGVVERRTDDVDDPDFISKHISCMSVVEAFLKYLTGTEREGRVIIERPDLQKSEDSNELRRSGVVKPCYRYLLLDPSVHFNDVVDEAHAIVLAGGTLRPFPHVATELFGHEKCMVEAAVKSEKDCKLAAASISTSSISRELTTFVCGHVVPSSNVSVSYLSNGPTKKEMDFRHSNRSSENLCQELGLSILNIAKEIPGGFVVFFPSYTYEAHIVQQWKRTGIFHRINQRKKIFREPKCARDVEKTLGLYSKCAVQENHGAILLCVINGKMSEGINFANDMARCVLIVGLPYPDITDPELQEKMQLLDKNSRENKQFINGQMYYQNLCMRAVNQSIGRAIRHINDYASIILADVRYVSDPKIWSQLPSWLKSDQSKPSRMTFEENIARIQTFFRTVASRQEC